MKRFFWLIGSAIIFIFGEILHYSYITSNKAVWSILISSVNSSAWEILKPFTIAYIMWIVIELSVLRPSLLHFVCAKIISLYFLVILVIVYILCINMFSVGERYEIILLSGICPIILFVQFLSYRIYKSKVKIEIFWIPILLSLFLFLIMILFLTLYPPHFIVFYDMKKNIFGIPKDIFICNF